MVCLFTILIPQLQGLLKYRKVVKINGSSESILQNFHSVVFGPQITLHLSPQNKRNCLCGCLFVSNRTWHFDNSSITIMWRAVPCLIKIGQTLLWSALQPLMFLRRTAYGDAVCCYSATTKCLPGDTRQCNRTALLTVCLCKSSPTDGNWRNNLIPVTLERSQQTHNC